MKFVNITRDPNNLRSLQMGLTPDTSAKEAAEPTRMALKERPYGQTEVIIGKKKVSDRLNQSIIQPVAYRDDFLGGMDVYIKES